MHANWTTRRNTLKELEEYTGLDIPTCGWYMSRSGEFILIAADPCGDGFRLYAWDHDPRPVMAAALKLPMIV